MSVEKRCLEDVAIPHWHFYKPRPTQSHGPDARLGNWPENLSRRRHFHYVDRERIPTWEPMPLPQKVENQRITNIDSTGTTPPFDFRSLF